MEELRAQDARVQWDPFAGEYTIESSPLEIRLRQTGEGLVTLASLRQSGREWIRPAGPAPAALALGSMSAALRPTTSQLFRGDNGELGLRLQGRLGDTPLIGTVTWRAYPSGGVVRVDAVLRNEGSVPWRVVDPPSLWLPLAPPAPARLVTLRGGAFHEDLPPRGYALEITDLGTRARRWEVGPDGRSSAAFLPWFALLDSAGGLTGALLWSGRWHLQLGPADGHSTLTMGLSDLEHELAPGREFSIPAALIGAFVGDLDAAGARLHEWEERYLCPPVPADWPWVQYNHWYAYLGDIDAERLWREARVAAEVGCEVFVIDGGWFAGGRPDSYVAGWGNWVEDRAKFPDGLRAFGERLRELGLRFGLWVEPERVDSRGAVAGSHPNWLAVRDGQVITRTWGGELDAHLCLGVPEVQEWMAQTIIRVVQEYGVDWLKWDYNVGYGVGCDRPDHGHQRGDGAYAYTLGLYRVLEAIRAACPGLVIENCASGGNRVDLGILQYTHTQWLSDYTHRAASCRQHAQGAWYALPPFFLNTWVLDQVNPLELRSRMGGAFGVSARLSEWSAEQRQALARAIAEYKQIRPLVRQRRYVLGSLWHAGWDIWQFADPTSGESAILAFRDGSAVTDVRVPLRGLVADFHYRVVAVDHGSADLYPGAQLLEEGLRISLPVPHTSALIRLEPLRS